MLLAAVLTLALQDLPPGASTVLQAPLAIGAPVGLQVLDAEPLEDGWIAAEQSVSPVDATLFVRRLDTGGAQLWSNGVLPLAPTGAQFSEPCGDVAVLPGPGVLLVAKNTIDGVTGVAVADAVAIDVQSGATLWSLSFDLDDYEVQRIGVDVANDRFLLTGRRDTFVWFTALDAVTGQTVWTYEHPTQDTASEITELDLSKDGQVLGVAGSARMTTPFRAAFALLLDSATGNLLWEHQDPANHTSTVKLALHPTEPRAAFAVLPIGVPLPDRLAVWEWSTDQSLWTVNLPHTATYQPLVLEWTPDGSRIASLHAPFGEARLETRNALNGSLAWQRTWTGVPFQPSFLVNGLPDPSIAFDGLGQTLVQFSLNGAAGYEARYDVLDQASGAVAHTAAALGGGVDSVAVKVAGPNATGGFLRCVNEGVENLDSPLSLASAAYLGLPAATSSPAWSARPVELNKEPIVVISAERCPTSGRLAVIYEASQGAPPVPSTQAGVFDPVAGAWLWNRIVRPAIDVFTTTAEFYEFGFTEDGVSTRLYAHQVKNGVAQASFEWIDAATGVTISTALTGDPAAFFGLDYVQPSGYAGFKALVQGRQVSADLGDRVAIVRRLTTGAYRLTAYARSNGAQLWDIDLQTTANTVDTPFVASFQGRLYCQKPGARLWRIDPQSGAVLADSPVASSVFEALAVGDSGVLSVQRSTTGMDLRTFNENLGFLSFADLEIDVEGLRAMPGSAGFAVIVADQLRQVGRLTSPTSAELGWSTALDSGIDPHWIGSVDGGEALMLTSGVNSLKIGEQWFDVSTGRLLADTLTELPLGLSSEGIPLDFGEDRA
ncbi:MAG: outer membrane protein assembly factor BamB family protein, partial [Planctomycetota bacterium]